MSGWKPFGQPSGLTGIVCFRIILGERSIANVNFPRRLALLEGRACQIDHIDISTPRPLCYFEAKENYAELPLSSELIYACHVEFCHLQDVTLTKM